MLIMTQAGKVLVFKPGSTNWFGALSIVMYVAILFAFSTLCVIIVGLRTRLRILNQQLNENFKNDFKIEQFLISFFTNFENLKNIIDILNELFAVPLAIFIGTNLFLIAFLFYDYYALYALPVDYATQFYYCVSTTLLRSYMFVLVFAVIYCCMTLKNQEKATLKVLQKFAIYKSQKKATIKVLNLAKQIEISSLNLTCGMFVFDWKILFRVSFFQFLLPFIINFFFYF